MFLFGGVAKGVTDKPLAFSGGGLEPVFAEIKDDFRMIFGNITKMIGDGASDIEAGIVFESFKERKNRGRI